MAVAESANRARDEGRTAGEASRPAIEDGKLY